MLTNCRSATRRKWKLKRRASPKTTDLLFVTHRHQVSGGAEMALLELLSYLKRKGFICHVIVGGEGTFRDRLKDLGIDSSIIGQPFWAHGPEDNSPFIYSSPNPRVNSVAQTVELIERLRPRLCVTNTVVVPWLAYASSITNTPHAWMIHELATEGMKLQYEMGDMQTFRAIDQLSDAIFVNSEYSLRYYKPRFSQKTPMKVVYPVGQAPKVSKVVSPFSKNSFKLVCIGQVKPQKGQFDSVAAVKSLIRAGYEVELIIIGDIEDKEYGEKIADYIKASSLTSSVKMLGYKSNPGSYINIADAVIVSSVNDAFGRITVEAMMLGKPVIGAASAGTLDIINDGVTGLLYNPGDADDLAKKILYLLEDPDIKSIIGNEARSVATNKYQEDRCYEAFLQYANDIPMNKSALVLSPLDTLVKDYERAVALMNHFENRVNLIENSRSWKMIKKINRIFGR